VWSVLGNFLCSLVLVILKPFNVDDEVELPDSNVRGRVSEFSVAYTTLESAPGETVMIPNNLFFQIIFKRRLGSSGASQGLKTGVGEPGETGLQSK